LIHKFINILLKILIYINFTNKIFIFYPLDLYLILVDLLDLKQKKNSG